jgi:hypothetical protein
MGCNPWKISELQKNPEWVQYQTILNAITLNVIKSSGFPKSGRFSSIYKNYS